MVSKNKIKILDKLKDQQIEISVSKLSDLTKIDPKNIGRYLKSLESEEKITIRTEQKGKIRTKYITIRNTTRKDPLLPKKTVSISKVETAGQPVKTVGQGAGSIPASRTKEKPQKKGVKPRTKPKPTPLQQFLQYLPEADDLIKFSKDNQEDEECISFYKHTSYTIKRGGGGWIGVVKNTLAIMRKMIKKDMMEGIK